MLKTLRAQHRGLAAALDRLSSALSRSDYSEFCVGLEVLDRLLKEHQAAEEQLLQPLPPEPPCYGKQPLKTLAALFERDHDRLLALLDDAAVLCRAGSYPSAAKVFGEFRHLIERHMTAEERALDTLGREGHCPPGLAAEVVQAHRLLHGLIEETWRAMQYDGVPFENAFEGLKRGIAAHERTEQEELLPALCACYPDSRELERAVHELL